MNKLKVEAEFNSREDLVKLIEHLNKVLVSAQITPGEEQVLSIAGNLPGKPVAYQVNFEYNVVRRRWSI